jgi:VWFA-related protein
MIITGRFATSALLLAVTAALAADAPTSSAPPARSPLVVRVGVDLVQLDAIVTDRDGKHVTDLRAEDFELVQDGIAQAITHCEYITVPVEPRVEASPGAVELPEPQEIRRTIAIVVSVPLGVSGPPDDVTNASPYAPTKPPDTRRQDEQVGGLTRVRDALHRFVDESLRPGDLVAIVSPDDPRGALHKFTTDRRVLHAAIDAVHPRPMRPNLGEMTLPGMALAQIAAAAYAPAEPDLSDSETFRIADLRTIDSVARVMRDLPGRKSLLYIHQGIHIPWGRIPSGQLSQEYAGAPNVAYNPLHPGFAGEVDGGSLPFRTLGSQLHHLADVAHRAGTVIYMIKPGIPGTAAGMIDEMLARDIAATTGGLAVAHNDVRAAVREAVDDQSGYYLLGYSPPAAGFNPKRADASFHKIELRVKREGLYVRTRTGYIGVPEAAPAPTGHAQDPLMAALVSPFRSSALGLRLLPTIAYDEKGHALVRTLLQVDADRLQFSREPSGHRATVDVLLTAFDGTMKAVNQTRQEVSVAVPEEELPDLHGAAVVADFTMRLGGAGPYQIRVALRDRASGRIDNGADFLRVPELGTTPVLEGLVVTSMESSIALLGEGRDMAAGGLIADGDASPVRRRFRGDATLLYSLHAYNVRDGAPLAGTLRVKRGETTIADQPLRLTSGAILGEIKLPQGIEAGAYALEVVGTEGQGKTTRTVTSPSVDFQVAPD